LNENQTWILKSKLPEENEFLPTQAEKTLSQIHDLEISEFTDPDQAKKFEGKNMIILKSSSDQLVFQLNWGPLIKMKLQGLEKEVYLARTQIDKSKIDDLNFDRVFKKIEAPKTETSQKEPQK
jgi:hypothetical protein